MLPVRYRLCRYVDVVEWILPFERVKARALGLIMLASAMLGLEGAARAAEGSPANLAYAVAVGGLPLPALALLVRPVRIRRWVIVAAVMGCAIVAYRILDSPERSVVVAAGAVFIWLCVYCFLFFPRWLALVNLLVIEGVLCGCVFVWSSSATARAVAAVAFAAAGSGLLVDQVVSRLGMMAVSDSLTGVLNRAALEEVLKREIARSQRFGHPFTVMLADLDGFKQVNDRFGHLAGDGLLKECAKAFSSCLRATDLVARYGGDEFVLVLPGLGGSDVEGVARRIREAAPCGVSLGWASYEPGDWPEALIARADEALYAEKASKRATMVR